MNFASFNAWRKEKTTIAGIGVLSGTATSILMNGVPWKVAVPLGVFGLVIVAMPENKPVAVDAQKLATDLLTSGVSAATLLGDGMAIVRDTTTTTTAATTTVLPAQETSHA